MERCRRHHRSLQQRKLYNQICSHENVIRPNYMELSGHDLIQGRVAIASLLPGVKYWL